MSCAWLQLALCGQAPETALLSALASVQFYVGQTELHFQYRERKLNAKIGKIQEACRKKLQEVHGGYTMVSSHLFCGPAWCPAVRGHHVKRHAYASDQAKKKYHEVLQAKNALEADNQELQQKYSQKALQTRKLQEIVQKLQQDYDAVCRSKGLPQRQPTNLSPPALQGWPKPQENMGHMV